MYAQQKEKVRIDLVTVVIYITMAVFGWMNIYSADSAPEGSPIFDFGSTHGKQIIWIAITIPLVFMILITDAGFFNFSGYIIYAIILSLLLAVLVTGNTVAGSTSWFQIGGFKLQPSEFAKYGTCLALAKFLGTYQVAFKGWKNITIALSITLIPMLLILKQNDTGSALVFTSFVLVFYREGLHGIWLLSGAYAVTLFILTIIFSDNIPYLFGSIAAIATIAIILFRKIKKVMLLGLLFICFSGGVIFGVGYFFNNILKPYQQERIQIIFGLIEDNKGAGYNLNQSKIAIGAGRFSGRGFLEGTQTKLGFVPEQHTDFIFCTVGEEWGFIGSLLTVSLYLLLIARIIYLSERQRTTFSRVFGYCAASVFFIHFLINIGMTIGLVPVIGIPLPFFSYGGSSFISFSILLFTFLKLDANRTNEMSRAFD